MKHDTASAEPYSVPRQLLRGLPVLEHSSAPVDDEAVPARPADLFMTWLEGAIDAGVLEPHAMVLSTTGEDGMPDARVLILKDVRDDGWWFATDASTAKARQLSLNPVAALTFYWPAIGRQVRLRGSVRNGSAAESERDFLDRGAAARAVVVAAQTSSANNREEFAQSVSEAEARLTTDSSLGTDAWRTYALEPTDVEFWQADPDRLHQRLVYRRTNDGWRHRWLAH